MPTSEIWAGTNLKFAQKSTGIVFYKSGKTRQEIAQLRLGLREVSKAIKRGYIMPPKTSGRPPTLTSDQVDELKEFVCSCRERRQMTYLELAIAPSRNGV